MGRGFSIPAAASRTDRPPRRGTGHQSVVGVLAEGVLEAARTAVHPAVRLFGSSMPISLTPPNRDVFNKLFSSDPSAERFSLAVAGDGPLPRIARTVALTDDHARPSMTAAADTSGW